MKNSLRRITALCLVAVMIFAVIPFTANAAEWIPADYKNYVFDAEYYAAKYPEVVKAYGSSETALYNHFLEKGVAEGKKGSPTFSAKDFLYFHADLKEKFGTDYEAALLHYCSTRTPSTNYQTTSNKYFAGTFDAVISRDSDTANGAFNVGVSSTATSAAAGKYNVQAVAADITDTKQIWTFKFNAADNSYTITNKFTGTVLDVNGGSKNSGTNVSTYNSNGSAAQKWRLYERLPGQYVIAPVHASGFVVLDIGGSTANGTNVQTYKYNHTPAQLFNIQVLIPDAVKSTVFDYGYYAAKYPEVASKYGSTQEELYEHFTKFGLMEGKQGSPVFSARYYIDNNPTVKSSTGNHLTAALMHYYNTGRNTKGLKTAPSSFIADTFEATINHSGANINIGIAANATSASNNAWNVQTVNPSETDTKQVWTFKYNAADGSYRIINKAYPKAAIDTSGVAITNSTNIATYTNTGSDDAHRRWFLFDRGDGRYVISPAHSSGKVMDGAGGGKTAGKNIQLYTYNGTTAQIFTLSCYIPTAIKDVVFDVDFYRSEHYNNYDVYKLSNSELYKHFLTRGLFAGMQGSPVFDATYYLENNASVKAACGTNLYSAVMHYYNTGRNTKGFKTAPAADLGSKFEATINHTGASINVGIASNATNASNNAWNVQTVTSSNSDATQTWVFTRKPDGSYMITNKAHPNAALDVSGVAIANSTNIATYTNTGVDDLHRHWYLYERIPGCYVISPAHSSGKVVDIAGGYKSAGKNIQLYTYNHSTAQYYNLTILNHTETGNSVWYKTLTPDDKFTTPLYPSTADKHTLLSYEDVSIEEYKEIYKGFVDKGFEIYSDSVKGALYTTTFVDGEDFYHVYWSYNTRELRIVEAIGSADCLPAKDAIVSKGITPSITQLQSSYLNGMGYIVQLSDGSFIVVDGGYSDQHDGVYNKLVALNGGKKENIVIRAWLLTHAHNDHYECFVSFAQKYASAVTLELFMYCPETPEARRSGWGGILTWGEIYDYVNMFDGAKVLTVHTGMDLKFGDVNMEILFTADDLLMDYTPYDQNEMSVVSRFYTSSKKALVLADAGDEVARKLEYYYGSYLKSDICQAAHHGVEDFPLSTYNIIKAPTMFYPCSQALYDLNERANDVRDAIAASSYIKEILIHQHAHYTRPLK